MFLKHENTKAWSVLPKLWDKTGLTNIFALIIMVDLFLSELIKRGAEKGGKGKNTGGGSFILLLTSLLTPC